MNENILVSVIMCVYNTPQEYLNEAVCSIIEQTHNNFELLIVDDGSDGDLFVDDLYNDKRICIIKNAENRGPSFARNQALRRARGKYIAIMDSDDISLPDRLEEQSLFLEHNPDVVALGTWFQHFGEKNNIVKREIDDSEYYRCCLLFDNVPTLLNSSVMIRSETLSSNNISYDEELRFGEDYKMWVELSQLGKITILKKVLVKYRVHRDQLTYKNSLERKKLKLDSKIRLLQLNKISSTFTEKEKEIFISYFKDKHIKGYQYYMLLKKIVSENKKNQFVDTLKLEQRVAKQWEAKIMSINNPFSILWLQIRLPYEFGHIFLIKYRQLIKKIRRKKYEYLSKNQN